jgi:hypothetical protein
MTAPTRSRLGDTCLSDFQIDALLADETGGVAAAARTHLSDCDRCQHRLAIIERERNDFMRAHPSPKFEPGERKVGTGGRPWLAAAALVLVAGALSLLRGGADQTTEPRGIKGGSALGFYVKHGGAIVRGGNGQVVHPGDQLRFVVRSTKRNMAIVSIDGGDNVSIYFPAGSRTATVKADQDLALPESIRLDGVLGRETIYSLFCDGPTDLGGVRERLRAQPAGVPIVSGCEVVSLTISKVP